MAHLAFLKLDKIDGTTIQKGFAGHHDVMTHDWSMEKPETGGGTGAPVFGDLVVQTPAGEHTPLLLGKAVKVSGAEAQIKTGELTLTKQDPKLGFVKFLTYKMTNCLVNSYRLSDPGSTDDLPLEAYTLHWSTLEVASWDGNTQREVTFIERNPEV